MIGLNEEIDNLKVTFGDIDTNCFLWRDYGVRN